ncbi:MAG: aminotransferase class III-fold pyridoxal phosphate-dependent enzyme [Phycisphaerales bacterium]|nr:aminotransferase class III-fold pyridoxal phosphate-dependent enzyme [Phycisphaerales bacterium]
MTTQPSIQGLHHDWSSPAVDASLDRIIEEIAQAQSSLTGVRGPDPDRAEAARLQFEHFGEIRGRGLFYPLMGAGLGRGALVELIDGSVKYDFITGVGVNAFGHGDLDLIRTAMVASMGDVVMQGNLQCNLDAAEFAALLLDAAASPSGRLKHCFLANSGALANENALKICMQHTDAAPRVLTFEHCFAGRTTAMAQIGDSAGGRQGLAANLDVDYLPFFDEADPEGSTSRTVAAMDEAVRRYPSQHSCFMMELVQGEGGFNAAPREFFLPLLERARAAGIPIWFDEVQSFGRTEDPFRFQTLDLEDHADVVTLGKLSQVCATLYTEELNPKPGLLSATFIGSTAAFQVGRRMIERLRSTASYGPDGRHAQLHASFRRLAGELVERLPDAFPSLRNPGTPAKPSEVVGGVGGMMRLTPHGGDGARIKSLLHRLFEVGVIAFSCGHGPFHLRFLPPIGVLEEHDLVEVLGLVGDVLEKGD